MQKKLRGVDCDLEVWSVRRGKYPIYLLTVLFTAAVLFLWSKEAKRNTHIPLSIGIQTEEGEEAVCCWKENEESYYVFLPSYAQMDRVILYKDTFFPVRIDGNPIADGKSCSSFSLDTPYTVRCRKRTYVLTFLQSQNIPAIYIDVPSGSMEYIHEAKGNEELGNIRIYTEAGLLDYRGKLESIKGRGNGTWKPEKKPYSLKLSEKGDLVGLGDAQKWILLANAFDETNLRNKIVYDFSPKIGLDFTPDCKLVDLYLNGTYAGVYLLSERIEVGDNRVRIAPAGSFLVSKEWDYRLEEQSLPYVQTESGAALRIHYAALDVKTVERMWQSVEDALAAEDGIDPWTGKHFTELIDMDSWARKYLIEELFGNADASIISQFFYMDGSDDSQKIYAGPIWDQDLTFGNKLMWPSYSENMLYANRSRIAASPWFADLYQKEEFYQYVRHLWCSSVGSLAASLAETGMDTYFSQYSSASRMNAVRWDLGNVQEENAYIQTFFRNRIVFLNELWREEPEYFTVQVNSGRGLEACYAMKPGECLPELPFYEESIGWFRRDTDEPFDIKQPIYENLLLYLK